MYLPGWRSQPVRACLLSPFFLIFLVSGYAQRWDPKGAEAALQEARNLREQLGQATSPSRDMYARCIQNYRKVYFLDPRYGGCDNAIYEAGQVAQEMAERFQDMNAYRQAVRFFKFLVSDYTGSRYCPDALFRAAQICGGPLGDAAESAGLSNQLKSQFPKFQAPAAQKEKPGEAAPAQSAANSEAPAQPSIKATEKGASPAVVQSIRHWTNPSYTRVIIDLDREIAFRKTQLSNPPRIYFDLANTRINRELARGPLKLEDDLLKKVRAAQNTLDLVRVVLDVEGVERFEVTELHAPYRIVIDMHGKNKNAGAGKSGAPSKLKSDEIAVTLNQTAPRSPEKGGTVSPAARGTVEQAVPKGTKFEDSPSPANPPVKSESVASNAQKPEQNAQPEQKSPAATSNPAENQIISATAPIAVEAKAVESHSRSAPAPAAEIEKTVAAVSPKPDLPQPLVVDTANAGSGLALPKPPDAVSHLPETNKVTVSKPETTKSASPPPKAPEMKPESRPASPNPADIPKPALPTSRGDRTLTRMLGLKIGRIVIDPGHGGHDTGTIGPGGLTEKDLVLEISKQLKQLLEKQLNAQVLLTREEDVFIPLEQRTALANQNQADLFISIHANSSSSKGISGVETYYLDFARTAAEREIAARENAASSQNVRDLEELVKRIMQADKSKESRELASTIQKKLFIDSQRLFSMPRNRGVRRAPFVVLIGANMPSVLAEVAFISNPRDEKLLQKSDTRLRLAQSLYAGIEGYMRALGSLAQNQTK